MTAQNPDRLDDILDEVMFERHRQDAKWGQQNHPDALKYCNYPICTAESAKWLTDDRAEDGTISYSDILIEELAEAVEEARAGNREALREELIQVAAVAVAWVEKLDRGK